MPRTLTLRDPRKRTRSIVIDMADPYHYCIQIEREIVEESADTGEVATRVPAGTILREIIFDRTTDAPTGDEHILACIPDIQAAIEAMEAEDA